MGFVSEDGVILSEPPTAREGSRPALYPESILRGDAHPARTHPERLARGDRHGSQTHPEAVLRGEQGTNARLTTEDVREIRRRYSRGGRNGANQSQLATEFEVTVGCISNILLRKTWAHVS